MKTRFFLLASVVLLLIVSCGPSKHTMYIDARQPSKSGVDLAGKVVSVVFLENEDELGTTFNNNIAEGFASTLEKDYGTGEGSIAIYRMLKESDQDYTSSNVLIDLLVDTDADVIFLLDEVKYGPVFSIRMYCFDGMDKSEKVRIYSGNCTSGVDGFETGVTISESFKSQWKTEAFSLAYFDNEKWYNALDHAESYEWKKAMDLWFRLLETNDVMKRSCAEYNIALACYMLGDYNLAEKWLDRSDADSKLPNMSEALRKRVEAKK